MFIWASRGRNGLQLPALKHRARRFTHTAAGLKPGRQPGGILQTLEERGFIHQIAGSSTFLEHADPQKTGVYVGVDPTAHSLHVGHMVPFMALFWMHLHGFRTITVVGGATAQIGDPTWRTTARKEMHDQDKRHNTTRMETQLQSMWANVRKLGDRHGLSETRRGSYLLWNNLEWLSQVSILEVLQKMGVGLRMGSLLSRESVKARLDSDDGMALAEFCYPLLQAWDWWHMFEKQGVKVQIGGADQFGNIITGIEALKHLLKRQSPKVQPGVAAAEVKEKLPEVELMGFTVPLLTTSTGEKFGKSAGNAVWLAEELTSPFDLYAYMLSTPDDDVERMLKLFTFLPMTEIDLVMDAQHKSESERVAQHLLAYEFLSLAHSPVVARQTANLHKARSLQRRTVDLRQTTKDGLSGGETATPGAVADSIAMNESDLAALTYAQLFKRAGLVDTNAQGTRLIQAKGAYVCLPTTDTDMLEWHPVPPQKTDAKGLRGQALEHVVWKGDSGTLLIRAGKWNVMQILVQKIQGDES